MSAEDSGNEFPEGISKANAILSIVLCILAVATIGALVSACPSEARFESYINETFVGAEFRGVLSSADVDRRGLHIVVVPGPVEWQLQCLRGSRRESLCMEAEVGDSVIKVRGRDWLAVKHNGIWKVWPIPWERMKDK